MAELKYCELCKRNVEPKKEFSWVVFLFLCRVFYLPFCLAQERKCRVFGRTRWSAAQP